MRETSENKIYGKIINTFLGVVKLSAKNKGTVGVIKQIFLYQIYVYSLKYNICFLKIESLLKIL